MDLCSPRSFIQAKRFQRALDTIWSELSGSDLLDWLEWLEWLLGGKRRLVPVPVRNDNPREPRQDRK